MLISAEKKHALSLNAVLAKMSELKMRNNSELFAAFRDNLSLIDERLTTYQKGKVAILSCIAETSKIVQPGLRVQAQLYLCDFARSTFTFSTTFCMVYVLVFFLLVLAC